LPFKSFRFAVDGNRRRDVAGAADNAIVRDGARNPGRTGAGDGHCESAGAGDLTAVETETTAEAADLLGVDCPSDRRIGNDVGRSCLIRERGEGTEIR